MVLKIYNKNMNFEGHQVGKDGWTEDLTVIEAIPTLGLRCERLVKRVLGVKDSRGADGKVSLGDVPSDKTTIENLLLKRKVN